MIKVILFDLDMTLIDFLQFKRNSCQAAINAMIDAGLDIDPEVAIKELYELYDEHGMEDKTIFQKFLTKKLGFVDYGILAHGIIEYRRVRLGYLTPYPGVRKTLIALKQKGKKLAIVTDAPRLKAWLRLCSMHINDFFDTVVTLDDTGKEKPHELPFKTALQQLSVKPEECLMVGDNPQRDIAGAKALGIKSCLALYGQVFKNSDVKPDYTIKNITELVELV